MSVYVWAQEKKKIHILKCLDHFYQQTNKQKKISLKKIKYFR